MRTLILVTLLLLTASRASAETSPDFSTPPVCNCNDDCQPYASWAGPYCQPFSTGWNYCSWSGPGIVCPEAGMPPEPGGDPGWNNGDPGWWNGDPGWNNGDPGWNNGDPGWNNGDPGWWGGDPGWWNGDPGWWGGDPGWWGGEADYWYDDIRGYGPRDAGVEDPTNSLTERGGCSLGAARVEHSWVGLLLVVGLLVLRRRR